MDELTRTIPDLCDIAEQIEDVTSVLLAIADGVTDSDKCRALVFAANTLRKTVTDIYRLHTCEDRPR